MIEVTFEGVPKCDVDKQIKFINEIVSAHQMRVGEISFVFCNDDFILEINKQYLNHDYYTDIITFDYNIGDTVYSDIFISLDTVASNAESFNASFVNELTRVIFHGILHLVGYSDATDEDKHVMRQKEDLFLNMFHVKHPELNIFCST